MRTWISDHVDKAFPALKWFRRVDKPHRNLQADVLSRCTSTDGVGEVSLEGGNGVPGSMGAR